MRRLCLLAALTACTAQAQLHLPGASGKSDTTPAPKAPTAAAQTAPVPAAARQFDYFVLALDPARFYVIGLRPASTRGASPESCGAKHASKGAISLALPVMLNESAARKEWDVYGTCSGLAPADYFTALRRARSLIQLPVQLTALDGATTETPADIQAWFAAANPSLPEGAFLLACKDKKPSEIHACFDLQLRPRPCPPASVIQTCN